MSRCAAAAAPAGRGRSRRRLAAVGKRMVVAVAVVAVAVAIMAFAVAAVVVRADEAVQVEGRWRWRVLGRRERRVGRRRWRLIRPPLCAARAATARRRVKLLSQRLGSPCELGSGRSPTDGGARRRHAESLVRKHDMRRAHAGFCLRLRFSRTRQTAHRANTTTSAAPIVAAHAARRRRRQFY